MKSQKVTKKGSKKKRFKNQILYLQMDSLDNAEKAASLSTVV